MQSSTNMKQYYVLFLLWISLNAVKSLTATHTYSVINQFNHSTQAFTQGLIFDTPTQYFYEGIYDRFYSKIGGTGLYGQSSLRKVVPETGEVVQYLSITNTSIFGEGITIFPGNDLLYQLTWQTRDVFVYNRTTFALIKRFVNPRSEGWGLTHNTTHLILSDGSSSIFFIDPIDFTIKGSIAVTSGGTPVSYLNELEFIEGEIWANVWLTNYIVKINPNTGSVTGVINFSGMYNGSGDVLNGIAYDPDARRLFVTGKQWSKLFQVDVCPISKKKKNATCFPSGTSNGTNKKEPRTELYIVLSLILFHLCYGSLL